MNKTLKKALAVLLSVLMVAFSVPFTALAAEPTDSGFKVHVYATPYDCKDGFLDGNAQSEDTTEWKLYDLANMTVAEVMEDAAYSRDKGMAMFALVFTVEGGPFDNFFLTADYNGKVMQPAYWRTNTVIETFDGGTRYSPNSAENLATTALDTTGTTSKFEEEDTIKDCLYISISDEQYTFMDETASENGYTGSLPGEVVAVYGMQLLADCDLTKEITVRTGTGATVFQTSGDRMDDVGVYGNTHYVTNAPTSTYFTVPELGIVPGDTPTPEVQITYTYLNGDVTTIKEGEAAPAVTATKTEHVAGTETHKTTTYAWEADGENAFKEVATETTGNCTFKTKTPAQEYIHTKDQLQNGITAVETCTACGFEKGGEVTVAKHTYVKTEVAATCKVLAHDHFECECGDAYDENFTGELAAHDWQPTGNTRGDADCQTPGEVEFKCSVCQETKWEDGALGAHQLTKVEEVPATCTTAGTGEYYTCDVCHKMFADANAATEITEVPVIDALDHSFTNYVSNNNATCQKNATETAKCDRCDAEDTREILNSTVAHKFTVEGATTPGTCVDKAETVWSCEFGCGETTIVYGNVDPANHKNVVVDKDSAKAPTRAEAGKEADEVCTACGTVVKEGAVIPALGVDITVTGSSLGTATINGEAIANATKNVAYASAYTLTATANEGAEFLGWKVGNKIVSEETTYTTNAYADMTYVPVFAAAAGEFTVTFVDAYGNVVATVASTELPLAALPTAPAFAGLTFAGWDMTLEEVNALTASAKVIAAYDNDTVKTYTVSAPEGTTIVVDGVESTGSVEVTYNTKITVKADGATAWTVNGSTEPAAYGPEYTFYCGSDITVAPVTDVVTAKPAVEVVNKDVDGYKVTFLATRSVPAGYKLVESGFVYGKGMNADDLVLENVGKVAGSANGTVKQIVCNNKGVDGQFALSYGVKNMDASASAAAYVIYSVGGQSVVIYDFMSHDYNA